MPLVRIAKDWDWPDLMRQTPRHTGAWDGVRFTLDEAEECDFLVVLNNRMKKDIRVRCPEGRIWALMQEPYVWGFTDWMVEGHQGFDRVYSNHLPGKDGRYRLSHPALPWHVLRSFDELVSCGVPAKERPLSWIAGDCRDLPGHLKRLSFLRLLQSKRDLEIDLFGRAVRYIEDKWDGLAPYRYSIAVENTTCRDYWTEKVADCFLSWTVPIYHGCPNLEDYFPVESFLRIDIDQPRESLDSIRRVAREDDWNRRLPALKEARRRVLYEHQLFPRLAKLVRAEPPEAGEKIPRTVPGYHKSIRTRVKRALFGLRKRYLRLVYQ